MLGQFFYLDFRVYCHVLLLNVKEKQKRMSFLKSASGSKELTPSFFSGYKIKSKKQSRYRPGVAQRVPGS
jgi:hypothetical protein